MCRILGLAFFSAVGVWADKFTYKNYASHPTYSATVGNVLTPPLHNGNTSAKTHKNRECNCTRFDGIK